MADCPCNTNQALPMPKDVVELSTPLFHACGGRLYKLNIEIDAGSIMMGGQDVATRINSLERALQANTSTHFADTIAQRNQLGGLVAGDYCYVFDASADPSVGSGPAMYIWMPGHRWVKLYNGESPIDCVNLIAKNGGLAIDADGRIYVDFSKAPAATISQITNYIYRQGGGLAVGSDGRLYVDAGALALAGGGLESRGGKLAVKAEDIIKANGGLAADPAGKLYVDFARMPASQMRDTVLSMVQTGGGIGVDSSGKLFVDFGAMPTDKFEAMMKALRLPIWLTGNKNFYVNKDTGIEKPASGIWPDGMGQTEAKAFKKIQDCIDYVANNYNMGNYTAYIRINDGTYEENLILPEFSRQNGRIELCMMPDRTDRKKVVVVGRKYAVKTVACTGGYYCLNNLTFDLRPDMADSANYASIINVSIASVSAGDLEVRGCLFRFAPAGGAPDKGYRCDGLSAIYSGKLDIMPVAENCTRIETGFEIETENLEFRCFTASDGGQVTALGTDKDNFKTTIELNCLNNICAFAYGGTIYMASPRVYKPSVTNEARATGLRYMAVNGGHIISGNGEADFFPGANAGTAEAETFSWYK